jgi:hypothetical protein
MDRRRTALAMQAGYYLASGSFPLVSRRGFEALTGPKRDWWLVQTVALLAVSAGVALSQGARRPEPLPETVVLSALCAASFTVIDTVYSLAGTISPIYLADAAIELALIAAVLVPTRR